MSDFANRAEAIGIMLAAFPQNTGADAEGAARAFLLSVSECTDVGVEKAALEFIRGEVQGHDLRFAPSASEFAVRVRMHDKIGERVARIVREKPEALASLSEVERGYIERRLAMAAKGKKP